MFRSMLLAGLSLSLSLSGCAAPRTSTTTPTPPDYAEATSQTKCGVRRSADRPLVVEWPAADRAALEARAREGLVAVRYEGCEMEVLNGCNVLGDYELVPLTRKSERVAIRDADELYARLPVGAASLEGKLARSGQLVVDMTIVGRKEADRHVISRDELSGRCEEATHVLTGLTVGAFAMYTGAAIEAEAGIGVAGAGAGGAVSRNRELLASDGDPATCETPEGEDACAALLRVEAVPLAGEAPPLFSPSTPATRQAYLDEEAERRRVARKRAAWSGTAITSGVLAGASLGGIVAGTVLLIQYKDDTFGIGYQPTEADQRKRRTGTVLLATSTVGALGFTALALAARGAAHRTRYEAPARIAPVMTPQFAGLSLSGRF